jgi:diaminohydroxyphosphoribosylaminopyrimidine deaminase/5-amino-6-(5-phosphoribosylamino)uracil reductase
VVYGAADPNPKAAGGAVQLASGGVEARLERSEPALRLNAAFLTAHSRGRAFVFAKAACTAEGHMARLDGTSQWITGPWARAAGHGLRAEAGCVVVGCGTAVKDRPRLSVRAWSTKNQPARLVVDPGRRWPGTLPTEPGQAAAVRLVRQGDEQEASDVGCAHSGGRLDPHGIAEAALRLGHTAFLVEGGPRTLGAFLEAQAVDRLDLFVAEGRFGEGRRLELAGGLELARSRTLGPDAWVTFIRPGSALADPVWEDAVTDPESTNGHGGRP